MSLPKSKSRIITVESVKFRCMVGPSSGYNVFYAELDGVKGSVIHVQFDKYKNSNITSGKDNLLILQPKDYADIILKALELDWDPRQPGKPVLFDLKGTELIPRK